MSVDIRLALHYIIHCITEQSQHLNYIMLTIKGECSVSKKIIYYGMKTMHYPNTIRSHLVTIVPMAPFTPKSTSKLRSALYNKQHIRYSESSHASFPALTLLNHNNLYNHSFPYTFDYNHYV